MSKNRFIYIIPFCVVIFQCVVFCKKPKKGDYVFERTGTTNTISCPVSQPCSNSTTPFSLKEEVKLTPLKDGSFLVSAQTWSKDGDNVSYYETKRERTSQSSSFSYTINFTGQIKRKGLIEGAFNENRILFEGGTTSTVTTTGNFTIKKKTVF